MESSWLKWTGNGGFYSSENDNTCYSAAFMKE